MIDPTTPGTLGVGVYSHPELSWDATRLLFCFKGEPQGSTSIYEINLDGSHLRRITDPRPTCVQYKGSNGGQHDIAPAYLPDGRIVFLSTRPSGLVPCANEGVSILHVMNADGSDMHPISVNNVNEFDPAVLPDGRVLFGRWEYVDKNALTIQSLWSVNPDGTEETAMYANNMVLPEAVLDARPVPNSDLIVATFAKHNSTPRGSIAFINPRLGKNNPASAYNLEHPDNPTFDQGDSCEPWALSEDLVIFSGRPKGSQRNLIEMMDRQGHLRRFVASNGSSSIIRPLFPPRRLTVLADANICLHSPMLVKARQRPINLVNTTDRKQTSGQFFVQDIYKGLTGVKRGEIKQLRVIEETSRVSPTPGGNQPYNQTFLLSAALAFSVKNYLGVVPVDENGSAYFQAPSGRALYLQALDADGRLVQSMRSFVQAAPGTTRSCIGCHEHKSSAPANERSSPPILHASFSPLKPESWGSGYVDYPSMVQPILDRHCVSCHGGADGIAAGLDLSGGWTEHFNISYVNLVNRSETQLVAYWISGIDCMNGTAYWSVQQFGPRGHGSGAAPLADLIMSGHKGQIPNLTRQERDLLFAWIDSNGLYHGTWDYTTNGCQIREWDKFKTNLIGHMKQAGCMSCHSETRFEEDWINLENPQFSRLLRAPLARSKEGFGLEMCRDHKASPERRVRMLISGYAHAIQPIAAFAPKPRFVASTNGTPLASFASIGDPHYQAILQTIREAAKKALASPRQDMPGADILPGAPRQFITPPLPVPVPPLAAAAGDEGTVQLSWERSAATIGLEAEIHRGEKRDFTPTPATLLTRTTLFRYLDRQPAPGKHYYAIIFSSDSQRSAPAYTAVTVPPRSAPPANLKAADAKSHQASAR